MILSVVGYITLLCLSAAITGGVAAYAWRRRDEPGAGLFAGLMAATTLWSACSTATLLARDPEVHLLVEQVQWVGIVFVPVFWVLFAMSYTGYDTFTSARMAGVLSIIPIVSIMLILTPGWRDLVWDHHRILVVHGVAIADRDLGVLYWLISIYGHTLIGIGILLVLRLVFVSDYLFKDQAVLLVVGSLVPVVGNGIYLLGLAPLPELDVAPFTFAVTGLTFGYALFRRRLFELVPATRRLGRDTAIATLDDGILILDNEYRVIYLNPEAADVLDCDPHETLGAPAADLVDTSVIEFDVPDALAELHIEDRFYEARPSTITDRRDREIGHTLVLHDITARKHRERRLRRQRDELARLDRLNEVVRDITNAFVSATSRTAIEDAVCDRLAASDLYTEASIVVDPTDEIVAGDGGEEIEGTGTPVAVPISSSERTVPSVAERLPDVLDTEYGSWAVVPLDHGQTIYGALVLYTTRLDAFDSRELVVLGQFGDTLSQALNAVENQRLLLADTVTELEFRVPDAALAGVARDAACRLSLSGLVPASEGKVLVYCHVADGSTRRVVDATSGIEGVTNARTIDDESDGMVEFTLTDRSALLALSAGGANVRAAEADEKEYRVVVEVAPETDVRALMERVRESCPNATLAAKRDLDRPVATGRRDPLPDTLDDLTDRQREVLEAAYRAGYFRWPRDRTAEEVAESIGVSSPTLHKHLRRAEERLLDGLFDPNGNADRGRKRN